MLTKLEAQLASRLLDIAWDEFSSHGCNDFDLIEEFDLTAEQLIELDRAIQERNNSPKDHDPEWAVGGWQNDSVLMWHMSGRLAEEANGGTHVTRPAAADEVEEWKTRAIQRRGRVGYLDGVVDALCSRLGITREDAERLVE